MKPIATFLSSVSSASHRAQTILELESAKERKRKREAEHEFQRDNRDHATKLYTNTAVMYVLEIIEINEAIFIST